MYVLNVLLTVTQFGLLCFVKARYGDGATLDKLDEESSSSEEEDENAKELTEELEKDFFKTLSYLKKKDPCIYDGNVKFFDKEYVTDESKGVKKSNKDKKPMFLRDYERKIIEEKDGRLSDETDEEGPPPSPTLVQEQEEIKRSFKNALQDDDLNDDNEDSALGGLFEKREKTAQELKKENDDFRDWLKGQEVQLQDKNTESDLKYLHDFWNDPKLDQNELFLKDYILNKKFLEPEDKNQSQAYDLKVHDSDGGLSEDEATFAKQEEFEHKFNFRFEEPDQEFLKRFPRTMTNSMRKPDNRRKEKRKEVKERKLTEKERMKEDLKRLKALKRNEILQKIEKLKQVTGNANFGFQEDDLDGHFDPESHDKRMSELFSQDYYGQEDDDEMPQFPDIDEELELEKWDEWDGQQYGTNQQCEDDGPHCEDPDFVMDCDYNPAAKFQTEIINSTKGRKRNRKSKLAQALSVQKPLFDPNDKSFEQYVDEYYGLDYEDVIGDLPCRFKYRKVVPNSFGLTIEEILEADDKELNRWCSLKLAVQRRPEHIEKRDIHRYDMKSRNEDYKRKIIPSLYKSEQDDSEEKKTSKKAKKRKKGKSKNITQGADDEDVATTSTITPDNLSFQQNGIANGKVKLPKFEGKKDKSASQPIVPVINSKDKNRQKDLNMAKKRKHEEEADEEEDMSKISNEDTKKTKISGNSNGKVKLPKFEGKKDKSAAQLIVPVINSKDRNMSKKRKQEEAEADEEGDVSKVSNKATKKAKLSENSSAIDKTTSKKKKKKKKKGNNSNEGSQSICSSIKKITTSSISENSDMLSRRKKRNKKKVTLKSVMNDSVSTDLKNSTAVASSNNQIGQKNKKKRKVGGPIHYRNKEQVSEELAISDARLKAYGLKPKKFKNYLKYGKTE